MLIGAGSDEQTDWKRETQTESLQVRHILLAKIGKYCPTESNFVRIRKLMAGGTIRQIGDVRRKKTWGNVVAFGRYFCRDVYEFDQIFPVYEAEKNARQNRM